MIRVSLLACMQDHGGSVHHRWTLPGAVGQEPGEGARCKANRRRRKRLRRRRGCLLPEAAAATAAAGDLGGRVISNPTRPIIFIRRSVCMHLSSRLIIISMHVRLIHPSITYHMAGSEYHYTSSCCVASNMYNDCNLSSANCSCSRFYMILQLDLYILILFSLSGTAVDRA